MRAAEKDDQYASFVYEACRDAFCQLFAYQNETKLLGQMLYYVLTTSAGQQTLGEEYCDITQVHFAATKDSLSRHFNKFGDVLKVVILTDAGTGQPKGSAYVEFMRKEAAEHALSLDGTSFMSRILKILVATPGRLKDHIENTMGFATRLMGVKVLILDEADHLLDMGFCKDIEKIIVVVPKERQTLLFSATVPRYSKSLASTLLILAYH